MSSTRVALGIAFEAAWSETGCCLLQIKKQLAGMQIHLLSRLCSEGLIRGVRPLPLQLVPPFYEDRVQGFEDPDALLGSPHVRPAWVTPSPI